MKKSDKKDKMTIIDMNLNINKTRLTYLSHMFDTRGLPGDLNLINLLGTELF